MVRNITISAEAEEEIYTAYDWYEIQEPGPGDRFEIAVRRAIHAAAVQPEIYSLRFDDVRRVSVKNFRIPFFTNTTNARFRYCPSSTNLKILPASTG